MPWIETIREDDWDVDLRPVFDLVADKQYGRVSNILQIHSLDPKSVEAHYLAYVSAMSGTKTLRLVDRELIALVVSEINDCHY